MIHKTKTIFKLFGKQQELEAKLLSIAGTRVVSHIDPYSQLVLMFGSLSPAYKVVLNKLEANSCHWNCLKLKAQHPDWIHYYGYGLSKDGLWRSHSWLVDKANRRIIETTEKRVKYFGIVAEGLLEEEE